MITRTGPTGSRHLTPGARLVLWIMTASVCVFGGALRLWQNHQRQVARQAWEQQVLQRKRRDRARSLHLRRLSKKHDGTWTMSDLAEALNGGEPFDALQSLQDGRLRAVWTDPVTGRRYEFYFDSDRTWTGWGTLSAPLIPQPRWPAFDRRTDEIRRWIAGGSGLAPLIWFVLLILLLAWRRLRCVLAEFLLAVALIAAIAWFVGPGLTLTLSNFDELFWAVLRLVVSVTALIAVHSVRPVLTRPVCPTCEYNLAGNTSGRCPECGSPIPRDMLERINAGTV